MRDVRMRGFAERADVDEVDRFLAERLTPLGPEEVGVLDCAGRVLAADVRADVDIPPFARAAMDGYAVRGEDTFGGSEYDPVQLRVIGETLPGQRFEGTVATGEAVRIMTGAPLPAGADAVVMAEACTEQQGSVEVRQAVSPRKNVGSIGEDIRARDVGFGPKTSAFWPRSARRGFRV
jgi:molybdopterin molybdotransferase